MTIEDPPLSGGVSGAPAEAAIVAAWRIESAKIVAVLARLTRDVGFAEDMAQEALVAALERWPRTGVPARPGAWLLAVARRRAIDELRRRRMTQRHEDAVGGEIEWRGAMDAPDPDAALDDDYGDDLLRLVFTTCHPMLGAEARVALTLRLLGGLTTAEIARAFLVPEPTISQRLVRAKKTLADARDSFDAPAAAERPARLASVLEVIYLVFNEGYAASAGDDWMRPALCEDALRLGRVLARLLPEEGEVHGLVALMELHASRTAARTSPEGEPVLLLDQDRQRWDRLLIRRGLEALRRAGEAGGPPGPYALQAAIVACHARAATADATDWPRIAALYGALAELQPSPIVELNRAVAIGMAEGPAAGLAHLDAIAGAPKLAGYHLLPSVRGDFLARLGRHTEAAGEFRRAASLTRNAREQALLHRRVAESMRRATDHPAEVKESI